MNLSEILSKARWEAYRERRHCHRRRCAFYRDAGRALKTLQWSANRMPSGGVVVRVSAGDADKWDGFHIDDVTIGGATEFALLAACVQSLTLEAMQDVARATKDRLDGNPPRT